MNQKEKKISINSSSLVDLKAELFRKQEELKQQKLANASSFVKPTPSVKKPNIWNKANSGVLHRAQSDLVEKTEENDELEKSKSALEAKTRLYEQMLKGDVLPEEDGSILYLVDFQQKALEVISGERRERLRVEEKEHTRRKEEQEEKKILAEQIAPPDSAEEEWVDYVDSFGRSRKCLRKDLQYLKDVDNKLSGKTGSVKSKVEGGADLMSADMRRELQRQEWEREAEEAMKGPVGPTHYANVQRNEVRDHGVGYFQFAKDEETRQQQLDDLNKLRNQTQEERDKRQKIKDKRDALLQARLAKVKQRKTVQDSADLVDLDPMSMLESLKEDANSANIDPQLPIRLDSSSVKEVQPIVRDESFRKTAPEREWDRGKKPVVYDERSWLDSRRDERLSQFAPPTALYESSAKTYRRGMSSGVLSDNVSRRTVTPPDSKHDDGRNSDHSASLLSDDVEQMVDAAIKSVRKEQQSEVIKDAVTTDLSSQRLNDFSTIPLPPQHSEKFSGLNPFSLPWQQINKVSEYNSINVNPVQTSNTPQDSCDVPFYGNAFDPTRLYGATCSGVAQSYSSSRHPYSSSFILNHTHSTEHDPNTGALWASHQDTSTMWASQQVGAPNNHCTTTANCLGGTAEELQNTNNRLQYLPDICGRGITVDPGSHPDGTAYNADISNTYFSGGSSAEDHDNVSHSESGGIPPENQLSGVNSFKAPQPAHFCSAPLKPQPKKAKYEAIFLHELPPCLPAPPSSECVPHYPSQEEVVGLIRRRNQPKVISESAAIKHWYKQFDNKESRNISTNPLEIHRDMNRYQRSSDSGEPSSLKPKNFPSASPYVQSQIAKGKSAMELTAAECDPSK